MWLLSKVIPTPECLRVYIGSYWSEPYKNTDNEKLFQAEQQDLINDLNLLPRNSTVWKVNKLVKRAHVLCAHILILNHLRKQVTVIGREKRQKELIAGLQEEFKEVSRQCKVPLGDFPPVDEYLKILPDKDFSKFAQLNDKTYSIIEDILLRDLPNFMHMASPQSTTVEDMASNPFSDFESNWDVPLSFQEDMAKMWISLSPEGQPLAGGPLKQPLLDTKAPPELLKKIWTLSDIEKSGKLDKEEFILAMFLATEAAKGKTPPATLPESLIPPSKKKDTLF